MIILPDEARKMTVDRLMESRKDNLLQVSKKIREAAHKGEYSIKWNSAEINSDCLYVLAAFGYGIEYIDLIQVKISW